MAIRHWPSVQNGLLVSKTDLVPWFARAAVLQGMDAPALSEKDEALCRATGVDVFNTLVNDRALSDAFYDEENLEPFEDVLNRVGELEGVFTVFPEGIPENAGLEPVNKDFVEEVQAIFEYEDVTTIPLEKAVGGPFAATAYPSYAAAESEIRSKLDALHVELPADFPLWKCMGRIAGVVYDC